MFDPQRFLNNPEYRKLAPDEQREARQIYFESVIHKDLTYQGMAPVAQEALKRQFGVELEKGKSFKERIGFEGPGLVEGLTGSQLGKVIDIPLRVLGIPGALAGSTVEDITGSPGLGTAVGIGTDILIGAKGLGYLKALKGAGKAAGATPVIDTAASIQAANKLGRAPMAEFPGVGGAMRESTKRGQPFQEGVYTGFQDRLTGELGKVQTGDLLTRMQGEGVQQGFQNRLNQELGKVQTSDLLTRMRGEGVQQGFLRRLEDAKTQLASDTGVKLVGTAESATTKLWGAETTGGVADVKRQLWGQKGQISPKTLAIGGGAALGGAIGGLTAEEPEDRMRNALIGAGIGGATAGLLLNLGKSTPVLAGLGGILTKGDKGYNALTKTGKIAGVIETDAAPSQIAEAAKLPSAALATLPHKLQEAVHALDGEGINLGIFHAKTRLEQITPRLFGLTPRDLARNVPTMRPIADTLDAAADNMRSFEGWFVDQINTIYHPIKRKHGSIEKVNSFLDGQGGTLSSIEQSVALNARTLFNKAADLLNIPKEERITDYFTRIRDVITAQATSKVTMGGKEIPIEGMVQLVEGKLYVPIRVENSVPKQYIPYFMKERTTDLPATKLGLEPLIAYGRGFGRRLALSGGTNPHTNEPVTGALSILKGQLPNLPDDAGVLKYNAKWINDFLGIPTGVKGGVFGENTQTVVAELKKMQFMRTLALNPLSAALNLTQSLNTFAKSSVGAWLGAFSDIMDPTKRLMAKQFGIVGDIAKADIDALRSTPFNQLSSQLLNKAGFMFKGSETLVRQHAFFTGLRDAAKKGLAGDDAITYARRLVSETQFRFGKEGLPATFRATGGGMGELIQQFKTYPVNQMLFMKNLLVDDVSDLIKMQGIPFKRMGKFFGAMFALVGSDATTMGLDKSISKFLTDNEDQLRVTGFFPSLGIHIAGQLGMGVMPVENLRSLFFFLPGPMASMVMDAVSAGSTMVNKGSPTAPWGINYSPGPGFGEPMTADQAAAKLTRMFPLAGVMLNRLRRAYIETQTPGEVREAATIKQAFGGEPFTGGERLIAGADKGGPLRTLGGVQSPERAARLELGGEQVELIQARNQTVKNAARLVAVGQKDKALKLLDAFEKKYGVTARLSPQAIRSALLSARIPVEERRVRKAPRELRGFLKSELEDVE